MARASTVNLLSLDRFARIVGINPLHFQGATMDNFFPVDNRCADIWLQYSWQSADRVGREDLATAINEAEISIANELGWFPAPIWIEQENRQFPRFYRKDAYRHAGRGVRGKRAGVKLEYAKVIAPGQRATTILPAGESATVEYTDADGDGMWETATITVATTVTNVNELFCFVAGEDGDEEWEIREPRKKEIVGANVVFTYYSWQMIKPALWEGFPTQANYLDGVATIDLTELESAQPPPYTKVQLTVDVYRVYNDTTALSAQMQWEPSPLTGGFCATCSGTGCAACTLTTQDGCFHIRDALRGIVVPTPGSYSDSTEVWTSSQYTKCREPDAVNFWYYCGGASNRYKSGKTFDPLSRKWAYAIAQLAVARIERDFCSCGAVKGLTNKWRTDLSIQGESSFQVSPIDLNNPMFGLRVGEIMAARVVRQERHRIRGGGAV